MWVETGLEFMSVFIEKQQEIIFYHVAQVRTKLPYRHRKSKTIENVLKEFECMCTRID